MKAGEEYDVAIAGAGLAGGSLALRLAGSGLRVVLLDAAAFPREKLCGEFLSPECWGVLGRLGLTQAVETAGYEAITRMRLTTPGGRELEAPIKGADREPGIGISRGVLDHLIISEAARAGVHVIERARVSGPVIENGQVRGVVARHPERGPFEVRATVTIAADGRQSALVKKTGKTRGRSWWRPGLFGLKRHLRISSSEIVEPAGCVSLHVVPGGYVGSCRIGDNSARQGVNLCGLLPESLAKHHRGDLDQVIQAVGRRNPALDALWKSCEPAGDWKTISGVRVECSRPSIEGILYAGDCQGTVDPLGGQGMTMALLGAEEIAAYVSRAVAEGTVSSALQHDYDRAWHTRFDSRIGLCRLFHHALVNPWVIEGASLLGLLGGQILSAGYGLTREPRVLPEV